MNTKNTLTFASVSLLLAILSGCSALPAGDQHRPIVDGGDLTHYEADLSECQTLAGTHDYLNGKTKTDAAIGAVIGALAESGGDRGDILGGAIVGGAIGAGGSAYEVINQRKNIVINCMRNRGYNTVESTNQAQ